MEIFYAPSFVRMYKSLPASLKIDVQEKLALFSFEKNHKQLEVHKLKGKLRDQYSFRVNYSMRIVFVYNFTRPKGVILVAIGDHDIYK